MKLLDWLHARTGYRAGLSLVLDESLPAGTGWWFTLGSVLLFLLAVQVATGIALSLYYAPTPDHAYQSVQFITTAVPAGRFVRGLHYFGASTIVIFAVLHLVRVVVFGSYKPPRELTWLSGLALLLVILAFSLTGYLLPWDQRAYWATVVSVNIQRLAPFVGDTLASLAGAPGGHVGALTLSRWFAIHVIVLPAVLVALVATHLFLMRRHGISGPVRARAGAGQAFFPHQAARDLVVILIVASVVAAFALRGLPPLERMADPTDATYVPRPEWYFLGLFQLLKFMPGKLEIVGALILPALVVGLMALLPWLDPAPERELRRRPIVGAALIAGLISIVSLTAAGWRDRPQTPPADQWTLREIAGASLVSSRNCTRCHASGRAADPLAELPVTRPTAWVQAHLQDPDVIAPGVRPLPAAEERDILAMAAFARRIDRQPPPVSDEERRAALIFARQCIGCHLIDGDGGTQGPDLSHEGRKHDLQWLRRWIARPKSVHAEAEMPAFDEKLTPEEIERIAAYLASRR